MMKGGLITSIGLHALLAAWLLFSFGSPEPFEVTMSEALPVDLVPIEEMTQIQQGDKEAPKKEEAAKEVTKREDKVENAQNNGDNDFDLKSVPTPVEKPSNVQEQGAQKKSEKVIADQDIKQPENVEDILKEDTATEPTQDVAALEQPKVEVKPEPKPEPKVEDVKPVEEAVDEPLPDNVPVPVTRPKAEPKKVEEKTEEKKEVKVAEAKPEKQPDRKKAEKNTKSAKSTTTKDSDFSTDQISELLNKTDDKPGGAKRNKKTKAFGAEKATGGEKLSQDELNALKGLIEKNWTIMPGQITSTDIVIMVTFQLDQNGEIVGDLEVSGTGGEDSPRRALEGGLKRAVMKSAPFDKLPKDKYETWSEVTVRFRPSEIM